MAAPNPESLVLSADDVRKVARLAKIALSEAEVEDARARLSAVLGYMQRLQRLDLAGVEPMAHASDEAARLREDVPGPVLDAGALRAMAPAVYEAAGGGAEGDDEQVFIAVPKVIGEGGGA